MLNFNKTTLFVIILGVSQFATANTNSSANSLINQAKIFTMTSSGSIGIQAAADRIQSLAIKYGRDAMSISSNGITQDDCTKASTQLVQDSETFAGRSSQGDYRNIGQLNGNSLMRILSTAGISLGTSIAGFNSCEKSTVAAYNEAIILDTSLVIADKNLG